MSPQNKLEAWCFFAVNLRFPHFGRPAMKESLLRTVFQRWLESCGTLAIQRRQPGLELQTA